VSTGDPVRAARIGLAAEQALAAFDPARLLAACFMVDTEGQHAETIRRALDGVAGSFPQEFFFTVADQPSADVQGIYPPFADLAAAHAITGQPRNPLPRPTPPPVAGIAAGPTARRRPRAGAAPVIATGARRRRKPERKKAARNKATRKPPTEAGRRRRGGR
jgi:hypothetical protein